MTLPTDAPSRFERIVTQGATGFVGGVLLITLLIGMAVMLGVMGHGLMDAPLLVACVALGVLVPWLWETVRGREVRRGTWEITGLRPADARDAGPGVVVEIEVRPSRLPWLMRSWSAKRLEAWRSASTESVVVVPASGLSRAAKDVHRWNGSAWVPARRISTRRPLRLRLRFDLDPATSGRWCVVHARTAVGDVLARLPERAPVDGIPLPSLDPSTA